MKFGLGSGTPWWRTEIEEEKFSWGSATGRHDNPTLGHWGWTYLLESLGELAEVLDVEADPAGIVGCGLGCLRGGARRLGAHERLRVPPLSS